MVTDASDIMNPKIGFADFGFALDKTKYKDEINYKDGTDPRTFDEQVAALEYNR